MATIYDAIKIQNRIFQLSAKFRNSVIPNHDKLINYYTSQQQIMANTSFYKFATIINQQQEMISNMHSHFNSDLLRNIRSLHESISVIQNQIEFNYPVTNSDNIIKSISNINDCIQSTLSNHEEIDWGDLDEDSIFDAGVIESKVVTQSSSIDWKFLIPLIISLIGIVLQITSNIDSEKYSEQDLRFKTEITNSVDELVDHIKKESLIAPID